MKTTVERDFTTALVINGKPYSLVRELNPISNAVCGKCDLREMCLGEKGRMDLAALCWPDGESETWFFIEDWQIIDRQIRDYIGERTAARDHTFI